MIKILKNITKFLKKNAPAILIIAGIAAICSLTFDVDLVSAVDSSSETQEKTYQSLGFMVSLFLKGLNLFLWPFLVVLGDLMDNDLIIGPGMEETLLSIWVQVRNLVNIGFAVFLLVIAFYNVLPLSENEGNLAMKTALPKLVIGLILVNFTFLGGKIILDVANVGTMAAFALPEVVETFDFTEQREEFVEKVCYKEVPTEEDGEETNTDPVPWDTEQDGEDVPIYTQLFCAFDEDGKTNGELNEAMETTYFEDLNSNNAGLVMAVNMGALESLSLLKDDAVNDFSDLVINSMFALIMYFVMACSYIVLGLVLLARIVVLWVALALSPLVVLFYVIPQLKESVGSNLDIVEKVTKHLLAPIIIGLTMTIGYMMVSSIGDFGSVGSLKASELVGAKFLASGIDDMEKFVIAIASVVIVWTGIFAAASGTYAEFATNAVKGFGEKVGGAIAKAPLYATTIPVGVGKDGGQEKVSPMAIFGLADAAMNNLQSQKRLRGELQQLSDRSPIVRKLVGDLGGAANRSKLENEQTAADLARKDSLTSDQVYNLADSLYEAARQGDASEDIVSKLRTARDQRDLTGVQEVINSASTAAEVGMSDEYFQQVQEGLQTLPDVKPDSGNTGNAGGSGGSGEGSASSAGSEATAKLALEEVKAALPGGGANLSKPLTEAHLAMEKSELISNEVGFTAQEADQIIAARTSAPAEKPNEA